jgi:hypothetical protein
MDIAFSGIRGAQTCIEETYSVPLISRDFNVQHHSISVVRARSRNLRARCGQQRVQVYHDSNGNFFLVLYNNTFHNILETLAQQV